jgi:hypothetical protein
MPRRPLLTQRSHLCQHFLPRIEGGNAAGGTTACFPLSSSSPTGREGELFHTAREAARKKTPTWSGRGQHRHAAAPFPRKDVSAPCRASLLARGMSLLSAPSQGEAPQWSLQISFRSQLRGSDGFAPSSLVTVSVCDQPYRRHIRFCVRAYGRTLRFVKDISAILILEINQYRPAVGDQAPGS